MKLKEIVVAYKTLGEAKVSKLEEADVIKILKARKEMRKHAEDYEAFLKDVQETFKPENWDEIQTKIQKWQQEGENTTLTEAERIEINKVLIEYQKKVDAAVREELEKEIEILIEKLSNDASTKLLVENNWEIKKLDDLDILL